MKVPPFNAGPAASRGMEDYSTPDGARRLGHMIAEAWRQCGVDVPFFVEGVGQTKDGKHASFTVRLPTLKNGLPMR